TTEDPSSITEGPCSVTENPSSVTKEPCSVTEGPCSVTEEPSATIEGRCRVSEDGCRVGAGGGSAVARAAVPPATGLETTNARGARPRALSSPPPDSCVPSGKGLRVGTGLVGSDFHVFELAALHGSRGAIEEGDVD